MSVQEQEEVNTARWSRFGQFHNFFLLACLNCDLYLFVQMQDDMKESSVQSCCL